MSNKTILTKETYAKVKSWEQKYPDSNVDLKNSKIDSSWKNLFDELYNDERFENLVQKTLSESLESGKSDIHPAPEYVFNAFKLTSLDDLKVVIIGQDPYFSYEDNVHQAMGLSFSVPKGCLLPPSLKNIYKELNLEDNSHGDLTKWVKNNQFLMLNASLSVFEGKSNSHREIWKEYTDKLIKDLSNKLHKIIFILLGNEAQSKIKMIDINKHIIINSIHPSPLSAYRGFFDSGIFDKLDDAYEKLYIKKINWGI